MSDPTATDADLTKLLNFDPLDAAEKIAGGSLEDAPNGLGVALFLAGGHAAAKDQALTGRDDTTLSNKIDRYLRIVAEEGFEIILSDPFTDDDRTETLYVAWHRDGILLTFDTYWGGTSVNGGHFYYNVAPKDPQNLHWDALSSNGPIDASDVRYGYHDCREALRFNLARIREHWTFVNPWVGEPIGSTWLNSYVDYRLPKPDRDAVSAARMVRLPESVRAAMGVTDPEA